MKNTYFNALYLIALVLLAFLFYMSISRVGETASDGISIEVGSYRISAWGLVIGGLLIGMLLMYFQVRKKFRTRFPRSKQGGKS